MSDVITPIIIILVVFFFIGFGVNILAEKQCKNNITEMGKEYRYDFINGCRVSIGEGKFIYWDMYKHVEK